ncbi:MAG: DUF4199 domain-containing protein [Sphingobacteriales bacterium]|nr:DUF4199 domain-containing protein [Sphingobacteriales bacterium]
MTPVQSGVRYGLIGALINIILLILLYIFNPELIFHGAILPLVLIITCFMMVMAVSNFKKNSPAPLQFKNAFVAAFVAYTLVTVIGSYFQYALINYIDTDLIALQKQQAVEASVGVMKWAGASEDEIDKALDEIEKQATPTLGAWTAGIVFYIILGLLPAAIVALIMRQKTTSSNY